METKGLTAEEIVLKLSNLIKKTPSDIVSQYHIQNNPV